MRSKNRDWIYIIIILLLLGAGGFFVWKYYQSRATYNAAISSIEFDLRKWRSESGKWQAETEALRLNNRQLKEFYADKIKKLKATENIKRVKEIVEVELRTRDTIYLVDSLWSDSTLSYADTWLNFDMSRIDSVLNYTARDSISLIRWESRGLFKPTRHYLRGVSHNPNTEIIGLENIVVEERNRRFGIGPQVGVTWDGEVKPYIGVGVHWSLIRF